MKVTTKLLPRASKDPSFVQLKFSRNPREPIICALLGIGLNQKFADLYFTEDGKEMKLDTEKLGIKGVQEEVDRHSRILSRQEELTGS